MANLFVVIQYQNTKSSPEDRDVSQIFTFHSCQIQNVRQSRMQRKAAMSHCELQQEITNPFLASHLVQNLFLVPVPAVQEAPPPQAGLLPMSHLEAHTDKGFLFLQYMNKFRKNTQTEQI